MQRPKHWAATFWRPTMKKAAIGSLLMCSGAHAYPPETIGGNLISSSVGEQDLTLQRAEQKLQATFSNLTFSDFEPSPVPGFFQVSSDGRLIYYSPDPELLIFGQVFNAEGIDLTALEIGDRQRETLAHLDLSGALEIGDPDGLEVVEFTNPDCPYCRQLDTYLRSKAAEGLRIKRKIIFTARQSASAKKALSVLCADDPEAAFATLFRGGKVPPASCAFGQERLSAHTAISDQVGVTGTPSLLIAGEFLTGFPKAKLEAFLQSAADPQRSSVAALGANND